MLAVVAVACGGDDGEDVVVPPSTSTTASTSTSTTDAPAGPTDAAAAFAASIGFRDPVIGAVRDGEVDVRPTPDGPITTFLVQRVNEDWTVTGAVTDAIVVEQPAALDVVTSPVRLRGRSTAFEANVAVDVHEDVTAAPLGVGFVMGGSMGEMGPFDGEVAYELPAGEDGVVLLRSISMEDGSTWEAAVVPVRFGDASPCGGRPAPEEIGDVMTVRVFFTCGPDGAVVPVHRVVPRTTGVLRASIEALLAGPTPAERADGLESWFSDDTAGLLRRVDIDADGTAVVDVGDLRPVIPNASASAGSQLLLEQLDATVFDHPTVTSVEYRLDGSCQDFFEWLQLDCGARSRP